MKRISVELGKTPANLRVSNIAVLKEEDNVNLVLRKNPGSQFYKLPTNILLENILLSVFQNVDPLSLYSF